MDSVLKAAHRSADAEKIATAYETIGALPGVSIVARSSPDIEERCHEFMLGSTLQQEWYLRMEKPSHVFDRAEELLAANGWRETEPCGGRLVVYWREVPADWDQRDGRFRLKAAHFGFAVNDSVLSKFGTVHVYLHPLGTVLGKYGDRAGFYEHPSCRQAMSRVRKLLEPLRRA